MNDLIMTDEQIIAQVRECQASGTAMSLSLMQRGLEVLLPYYNERPQLATGLKPLDKKQAEVFDYLVDYIKTYRLPPSVREICDAVGLLSSASGQRHLNNLEKKGYIKRVGKPGTPRAIQITGKREVGADAVLRGRSSDKDRIRSAE